ncbi:MAG: CTP synthase [Candidatus Hodarchaeales archaeon]
MEAMRQLSLRVDPKNVCWIHVTLVPSLSVVGEQKTKPTQASVKTLQGMGIQPDILLCRSEYPLNEGAREKIAMFCNISQSDVISGHDTPIVYKYPFQLLEEGILTSVFNRLHIGPKRVPTLEKWGKLVDGIENPKAELKIGIGGKYTRLEDAYVSIEKALTHSGAHLQLKIELRFIETTNLDEKEMEKHLENIDGVIIPGGFGDRGIEGKIRLVQKIRESKIPFLGICLGLQCAVIEYARNVCGLKEANSTEFNPITPHPVLDLLPSQKKVYRKGGTMRLGAYPVKIQENTYLLSISEN